MSFFAKLAVLISANTTEFKAGLDDANKSTKKFEAEQKRAMREAALAAKQLEASLRTVAQVSAVSAVAIAGALKYADEISDTADAFDITVKSLMAMRDALVLAGGKADNFGTILQKLANEAQAAKDGTDKARASFEKLGITGREVEESAPDELFARVAKALSEVEDPIKRNAMAFDLLGKAAKGVDWKSYWQDYSSGKTTTEGVSEAIQEGAKAWDNLGKAGKAALEGILVLVKPFTAFINYMAEKLQQAKEKPVTGSLFDAEFGGAFGMQGEMQVPGKTPEAAKAAEEKKEGDYSTESASKAGFAAAVQAVREQTNEIMRQVSAMKQREEMQSKFLAMTKNERELAEAVFKIEEDRDKLIANAEKEIAIEEKRKDINTKKIDALKDQIETIKFAKQTEIEAITSIIQKRQEEQQSFSVGWDRAFNQYAEDSQNYARLGEQAFNTVISNMDGALMQFVNTGKFRFKDFAASVILDLIKIQMRMQMIQMFSGAKEFFSGFSFFGTQSPAPIFNPLSGMFGNAADGGPISGPTLVGEQGPELFIPNGPGTVIPNQQLSGQLTGNTYVTNNYIDAIDTKSFEERLLGSPNAIWAANKYADKSLQIGRGRT